MTWFKANSRFDRVFEGSLILKGVSGLAEFLAGALLIFTKPDQLRQFISLLTQRELVEDPNDIFANFLRSISSNFSQNGRLFLIVYLWTHALVKLIAVIGLLKNKKWAYSFSLVGLGLLAAYQIYSLIFLKFSIGLFTITVFDLFVLWMIWQEKLKSNQRYLPR